MGEGGRGEAFPKLATSGLTGSELGAGCWEDGILLSPPPFGLRFWEVQILPVIQGWEKSDRDGRDPKP